MRRTTAAFVLFCMVPMSVCGACRAEADSLSGGGVRLSLRTPRVEDQGYVGFAERLLERGPADGDGADVVTTGRSPAKEGAASFLLPGLGQYRMGRKIRSRLFFTLEGAAWIAAGSFLWQGYAREGAYKDYAVAFADVRGTGHSDDYYEAISSYMSNEGFGGYNEAVRREARELFEDDRAGLEDYYGANKIAGDLSWRWVSVKALERYRDLRSGSRSAYRRALYTVVFALALRVVSAVDAVRLAQRENGVEEADRGGISLGLEGKQSGFYFYLAKVF